MPESAEITRAAQRGLMRPRDVANYLGVSRQWIDQLAALGRLPEPRLVAGHRMWERAKIEDWASKDWWGSRPWRMR